MEVWEAKAAIEAMLVSAARPLRLPKIAEALGVDVKFAEETLREFESDISAADRGLQLRHTTRGIRLETKPIFAEYVKIVIPEWAPQPLSSQAIETLAIIALKGPVTLADINAIRGVDSTGTLSTLRNRRLIARVNRLGSRREKYWKTTSHFLEAFHLNDLSDLTKDGKLAELFPELRGIEEGASVSEPFDAASA